MAPSMRSRSDARALAAAFGLVALLLAGTASAAALKGPTEEAARAEFKKGQTAYNLGQFGDALASYSNAYGLKAVPAILFNIAQCHRQLGDMERAAFFYRRFLEMAPKGDKNAATAQKLLDESQAQSAEQLHRAMDRVETQRQNELEHSREAAAKAETDAANAKRQPAGGLASSSAAAATAIPHGAIEKTPVYKQWWLWVAVGVVVVGAAAGSVAYVATEPRPSITTLGTASAR